eukprot:403345008
MKKPTINTQQFNLKNPIPSSTKSSTRPQKSVEKLGSKMNLHLKDLTIIPERQTSKKQTPKIGRNNSKIETPSNLSKQFQSTNVIQSFIKQSQQTQPNHQSSFVVQNQLTQNSKNIKQSFLQAILAAEDKRSLTDTEDFPINNLRLDLPLSSRQLLKFINKRRLQSSSSSRQPSASGMSSDCNISRLTQGLQNAHHQTQASNKMQSNILISNQNPLNIDKLTQVSQFPQSVKNRTERSQQLQNQLNPSNFRFNNNQDIDKAPQTAKSKKKSSRQINQTYNEITDRTQLLSNKKQSQHQKEKKLMMQQLVESQSIILNQKLKYEKVKNKNKQLEQEILNMLNNESQTQKDLRKFTQLLQSSVQDLLENNHFIAQKRYIKQLVVTLEQITHCLQINDQNNDKNLTNENRPLKQQIIKDGEIDIDQIKLQLANSSRIPREQHISQLLYQQNQILMQKIEQLNSENERFKEVDMTHRDQDPKKNDEITQKMEQYSNLVSKLHSKLKELGAKLEEVEKSKREKIREVRVKIEKEIEVMKERNQTLIDQLQKLEEELDKSLVKIEDLQDTLQNQSQDNNFMKQQIDKLNSLNENQQNIINQLQNQLRGQHLTSQSSLANGGIMGIDRSYCGSVLSQNNQYWQNGLGSALGNPQWNEMNGQIQDISELTSKSNFDERSSSIGADLKIISQSPNISTQQQHIQTNPYVNNQNPQFQKINKNRYKPSSQLSNYNNSNYGGVFQNRKQSTNHNGHNASNFYQGQDFAGTSIISVINPMLAEEQRSDFSNSQEKRLFQKKRSSSQMGYSNYSKQRRGSSGMNVSNYIQSQKTDSVIQQSDLCLNQKQTQQLRNGSNIRNRIDSSSQMSRNEANGNNTKQSSKTMTFAEKTKGPKVIGHLEDIIEDFQKHEDELTLRDNAARFNCDNNLFLDENSQTFSKKPLATFHYKAHSINQQHHKIKKNSSRERSYSQSPNLQSNTNLSSMICQIQNPNQPFRSKSSTPCEKSLLKIQIQSNQYEIEQEDESFDSSSQKKTQKDDRFLHDCNIYQGESNLKKQRDYENRLTQSDVNFREYITQELNMSMMKSKRRNSKNNQGNQPQFNSSENQQDKENIYENQQFDNIYFPKQQLMTEDFIRQNSKKSQHQSMILNRPNHYTQEPFMRRMSNIEDTSFPQYIQVHNYDNQVQLDSIDDASQIDYQDEDAQILQNNVFMDDYIQDSRKQSQQFLQTKHMALGRNNYNNMQQEIDNLISNKQQ